MPKRWIPVVLSASLLTMGCAALPPAGTAPSADLAVPTSKPEAHSLETNYVPVPQRKGASESLSRMCFRWERIDGKMQAVVVSRYPICFPSTFKSEGQVRGVDDATGMCVLPMGEQHGARVGDRVTVTRDGHFVAEVLVERVYADLAVAAVAKTDGIPMQRLPIQVGDQFASMLHDGR